MWNYLLRRLFLLPITLFFIILINFFIINLAPGDPVTVTEVSADGAKRQEGKSAASTDDRYQQFREFYGLTLPIIYNIWPETSINWILKELHELNSFLDDPDNSTLSFKEFNQKRILLGDMSRYLMPKLKSIMDDKNESLAIRQLASQFFIRGGTRVVTIGGDLSERERAQNQRISKGNTILRELAPKKEETPQEFAKKTEALGNWFEENKSDFYIDPDFSTKLKIFFTETRFYRYFSRVLTLNFGSIRNDPNKRVIDEVSRRFKYSLTLSILPMIATFFLCIIFGYVMASYQNKFLDNGLSLLFLILYATPIFVVAPFLIEKVALNGHFPFTNIPIPLSGFTSKESIYNNLSSFERLTDVLKHIALPLVAILYGGLAAQARFARTAFLEVMRHDYVRTAKAKGASSFDIATKHIGRNASITLVTAIAGSLGVILGGSLIVETLFEIDGFGKFFYDAIINRDYNVIMFSTLAGSLLTLLGYLVADISYTILDPRVTLE